MLPENVVTNSHQIQPQKSVLKRALLRLLLLTACVVGTCLAWIYLQSPLPVGAYSVLSTAEWVEPNRYGVSSYQWLPNGELAYLKRNLRGMIQVCYQKMDMRGPVGPASFGPELPLDIAFQRFFPSPDKQWIAYMHYTAPNVWQTFLLSADGKTTRQGGEFFSGWLADSRSYLALAYSKQFDTEVYHLDSPQVQTLPNLGPGNTSVPAITLAGAPSFLMASHFANFGQGNGNPQNYPLMTLRLFAMSDPKIAAKQWQAKVPVGMTYGTPLASPDNTHLLWNVGKQNDDLWRYWLGRLNPRWRQNPTFSTQYFISDFNGEHIHPVLANSLGVTRNVAPHWTPDGKHLSFVYQGQFYLVPVD